MTQKEIYKFLANTKVRVNGKSKEIQEKLFSLGYKWKEGETVVSFTEYPFLYIDNKHRISYGCDVDIFSNYYKNREISVEEIISIKLPEPTYRPFKTQKECWKEMLKHQPFGWIIDKSNNFYSCIDNINHYTNFDEIFEDYTFTDGTPFGIKED